MLEWYILSSGIYFLKKSTFKTVKPYLYKSGNLNVYVYMSGFCECDWQREHGEYVKSVIHVLTCRKQHAVTPVEAKRDPADYIVDRFDYLEIVS